jgi:hypothetical protein
MSDTITCTEPHATTPAAPGPATTPEERERRLFELHQLLTEQWPDDDQRYQVCEILATEAHDNDERELLIALFNALAEEAGWGSPLAVDLDTLAIELSDTIVEELLGILENTRDPGEAMACYLQLRPHCDEFAEDVVLIAAAHPAIPGTVIADDFPGVLYERLPETLLRKLEREEAWGRIGDLLEDFGGEPGIILDRLEDPDAYVEAVLDTILREGGEVPEWVWATPNIHGRFDVLRSRVPWRELDEYADDTLMDLIDAHLTQALGDDDELWQTFGVIGNEFEGTLDELVDVVRNL